MFSDSEPMKMPIPEMDEYDMIHDFNQKLKAAQIVVDEATNALRDAITTL